jgi:DNA polymerase
MIQVLEQYLMQKDESYLSNLERCGDCPLLGQPFVPGEGDPESRLMVVGEAPGQEEEAQLRPFVGKSGKLIRGLLDALSVEDVYITNVVKRRPTTETGANRKPSKKECYRCGCHLSREIVEIKPQFIVTLGSIPFEFFAGEKIKISHHRGTSFERKHFNVEFVVLPTWHPSFVLRSGGLTSKVGEQWIHDLEEFIKRYKGV